MAHVGEEDRLRPICGFGLLHGFLEFFLTLLEFRNIRVDDDSASVRGALLADAYPNISMVVFDQTFGLAVSPQRSATHRSPGWPPVSIRPRATPTSKSSKMALPAEQHLRLGIELAESAVAKDEPVIGVKQHEAVGNRFDSRLDDAALLLAMRRQFCPLIMLPRNNSEYASSRRFHRGLMQGSGY